MYLQSLVLTDMQAKLSYIVRQGTSKSIIAKQEGSVTTATNMKRLLLIIYFVQDDGRRSLSDCFFSIILQELRTERALPHVRKEGLLFFLEISLCISDYCSWNQTLPCTNFSPSLISRLIKKTICT